jgi:hypothetical protein
VAVVRETVEQSGVIEQQPDLGCAGVLDDELIAEDVG